MRIATIRTILAIGLVTGSIASQTRAPGYQDLTVVRNRPWAKQEFFEVGGGGVLGMPAGEDKIRYAEQEFGPHAYAYYHAHQAFGRDSRFDAYAGTDGLYVGVTEGDPRTARGYSRLELFGRQWGTFIREGFYRSDEFIPVGLYEHTDWMARLSLATKLSETMTGEGGGFYGQHAFDRNSQTSLAYTIPEDYAVYGFHAFIEDRNLRIDQATYLPQEGYIVSVYIQQEWNDSSRLFGIAGRESRLPSSMVRGGGHLEYYIPYTNSTTWVLRADAGISPKDDRITIYDASKPIGEWWGDGRVDYRILLGGTFTLTPGARVQYVKIADEFFTTREHEFFFGGQVELRADFSENLAISLEYSYLSTESRRPVSLSRDTLGEHRVYLGFEFRP